MTTIKKEDFISSVADALQYISCYHGKDFVDAMYQAWQREQSQAAKDAITQILVNSRMAAEGRRPICQDTGIVVAFLKIGMDVRWDTDISIQEMVDEGTRRAYMDPHNKLRASVVYPPYGSRTNTRDNTPAVVYMEIVPGDQLEVKIASKGGGSENKTKFAILNPSDNLIDWVLETVPKMGAGWCPPGMLGIGIGGTPEKSALMAKESLLDHVDMPQLLERGASNDTEQLRIDLYKAINSLGIGAQGLGGLTTVLDVKVNTYATHAVSLPITMIPNCAATRHLHFKLDGSGPATFSPPNPDDWPDIPFAIDNATQVDLNSVTREEVGSWKPGQTLLLNGKLLTGRDAAHKRLSDMLANGEDLPVDFNNRFIYYVGPVDPVEGEVVGPAGPTTATRMDKFTEMMLNTGLLGMVGKAERGQQTIDTIKQHQSVYLMAVGGAAYLVSKAIKAAKVIAFEDLGMEAIYEFDVVDMPVTVAVDSQGTAVHQTGPAEWAEKIRVEFKA